MSDSYALVRDRIATAIRNDATIPALVDYQIHTSGNTTINDSWLTSANHCCIVVTHQNRNETGLPGCAYHGVSDCDHLMRISVIQDQADSDTYAANVSQLVNDLIKKGITVVMNQITYSINFTPPIKTFTTRNSNFPNRIFVISDIRARYLGA